MIHFIVNPHAGNGKTMKAWKRIEPILRGKQVPHRVFFTRSGGEGAGLIAEWAADAGALAVVAVIGGDGSLQSVMAAASRHGITLGLIPAGSGNDMARMLNIPMKPEAALEQLLAGKAATVDALQVEGKLYATAVGIGLDGQVAYETNRSRTKRWMNRIGLGGVAYVLQLIKVLAAYRSRNVVVELDDRRYEFDRTWLVAVGNSQSYGGGMRICPEADPTDGLLDVTVVQRLNKLQFLRVFPSVYAGAHVRNPAVTCLRGRRLRVLEADERLYVHGDGEWLDLDKIEVGVAPQAIRIMR